MCVWGGGGWITRLHQGTRAVKRSLLLRLLLRAVYPIGYHHPVDGTDHGEDLGLISDIDTDACLMKIWRSSASGVIGAVPCMLGWSRSDAGTAPGGGKPAHGGNPLERTANQIGSFCVYVTVHVSWGFGEFLAQNKRLGGIAICRENA